jgi:Cupredoxin-like domain
MKNLLFTLLLAILLISTACKTEVSINRNAEKLETGKPFVTEKGVFTVEFKSNPTEIKTGEKTDLVFKVKSPTGETVKDLEIVHEKPMHLLIVSEDLDEFYHEHPEPQADGSLKTNFTFPNGGKYRLYADFTPKESTQTSQNFAVNVIGNERAAKDLKVDEKFEKAVENLRVVMKPDSELVSGKELMLDFRVFDAQTDQPVTDLENYLGEKAHFVIISQDLQEFVHAHPMSKDNVKKDEHAHDNHSAHNESDKMASPDSASIVSAHVSFPKASVYKLWAQFKRGGKVINVPFVFDIKAGKDEKGVDMKDVKIPEGAFKVIVTKDGFTPQEISYKKGETLKLAFYRSDAENCADEIVFKDLNITKKLPVGEVITVDVPTDKTGAITFACGMNMFKGKIIVE